MSIHARAALLQSGGAETMPGDVGVSRPQPCADALSAALPSSALSASASGPGGAGFEGLAQMTLRTSNAHIPDPYK